MGDEPFLDLGVVVERLRRRPRVPPDYVLVLPGGGCRAISVELCNEDGDMRWGSAVDSQGNRIEVHVHDGDPYEEDDRVH